MPPLGFFHSKVSKWVTGDQVSARLRRTEHLHTMEADEIPDSCRQFTCPAALSPDTRCTNLVNPLIGFCSKHESNLVNKVAGQRLSEQVVVEDWIRHLQLALDFPDDSTLVDNAVDSGQLLFFRSMQNMESAMAATRNVQATHLVGMATATSQTRKLAIEAKASETKAKQQWAAQLKQGVIEASGTTIFKDTDLMASIGRFQALSRAPVNNRLPSPQKPPSCKIVEELVPSSDQKEVPAPETPDPKRQKTAGDVMWSSLMDSIAANQAGAVQ